MSRFTKQIKAITGKKATSHITTITTSEDWRTNFADWATSLDDLDAPFSTSYPQMLGPFDAGSVTFTKQHSSPRAATIAEGREYVYSRYQQAITVEHKRRLAEAYEAVLDIPGDETRAWLPTPEVLTLLGAGCTMWTTPTGDTVLIPVGGMGQKSTGGTTTVGHQQASDVRPWRLVEAAAPYTRRVLLYGPPGTGKSYLARTAGVLDPDMVYPVPIHEDIPAAELRGHFIAQENGGFAWADGPAIMAWRNGGRLVLDEIDKAGSDGLSFLLAILDDFKTAKTTLATTGEVISPHEDFTIWATMNGELDDLPPALRDRFPVSVRITAPHPQAIAALPHDLQALAAQLSVAEPKRRVGLRRFYEFANLRQHMALLDAGELIFGVDRWPEIAQAIDLARATDVR